MSDRSRQAGESAALWERAPHHLAHRACRENITALLEAHPDAADRVVPACPEWTVRDLLDHVVGHYRPSTGESRRRRSAQPGRPAGPSVRELLDEWAQTGSQLERQLLAGEGGFGSDLHVMDTFTHELDLRRALDEPPPADHPAYPTALGVVLGGFSGSVYSRGLPALRIETQGAQWEIGSGAPAATVYAGRHDLYRSVAGRRTYGQIAELSWSTPPDKWLPAFTWGPFRPPARPTEDLAEAAVAG
jgi:uncharacterized protein (TIGR03083 family)